MSNNRNALGGGNPDYQNYNWSVPASAFADVHQGAKFISARTLAWTIATAPVPTYGDYDTGNWDTHFIQPIAKLIGQPANPANIITIGGNLWSMPGHTYGTAADLAGNTSQASYDVDASQGGNTAYEMVGVRIGLSYSYSDYYFQL